MKKIFLIPIVLALSCQAYASCAISGNTCAYTISKPSLQGKYMPDNLENIKKPDAFRPQYVTPYYDMLINTDTGASTPKEQKNYNSNCQFGICLPGVNHGQGQIME